MQRLPTTGKFFCFPLMEIILGIAQFPVKNPLMGTWIKIAYGFFHVVLSKSHFEIMFPRMEFLSFHPGILQIPLHAGFFMLHHFDTLGVYLTPVVGFSNIHHGVSLFPYFPPWFLNFHPCPLTGFCYYHPSLLHEFRHGFSGNSVLVSLISPCIPFLCCQMCLLHTFFSSFKTTMILCDLHCPPKCIDNMHTSLGW